MQHFSEVEWQQFSQGQKADKALVMENHLEICDQCRQLFLESIDAAEMKRAEAAIVPGFAAQTIDLIEKSTRPKRPYPQRSNTRSLLLYYTAAAVLTLALTGGGIIQDVNQRLATLPQDAYSIDYSRYESILWNWPAQLQEMTSSWLNHFDNINRRNSSE